MKIKNFGALIGTPFSFLFGLSLHGAVAETVPLNPTSTRPRYLYKVMLAYVPDNYRIYCDGISAADHLRRGKETKLDATQTPCQLELGLHAQEFLTEKSELKSFVNYLDILFKESLAEKLDHSLKNVNLTQLEIDFIVDETRGAEIGLSLAIRGRYFADEKKPERNILKKSPVYFISGFKKFEPSEFFKRIEILTQDIEAEIKPYLGSEDLH